MNNDVVIIDLDKERQLKFTNSAIKRLEATFGKDVTEIDNDIETKLPSMLEDLIYAGLLYDARKNDEELTREYVSDLLDDAPSLGYLIQKFTEAWRIAWSVDSGNEQTLPVQNPKGPKNSTGTKTKD